MLLLLLLLGGAVAVAAVSAKGGPGPKKPIFTVAPGASKSFVNPQAFYDRIAGETAALSNLKAAREAESDDRVAKWKATAKKIPYIGEYAGYFIDLGAWLGKKLGSNYAEQNSLEDLQAAADQIADSILRGYIPPNPNFTEKDGAKFYASGLAQRLAVAQSLSMLRYEHDLYDDANVGSKALRTLGLMSIAHSGNEFVAHALANVGGEGTLSGTASGARGTCRAYGGPSIVAALAHAEFGANYAKACIYACTVYDAIWSAAYHDQPNPYPVKNPLGQTPPFPTTFDKNPVANKLGFLADTMTEVMRAAAAGKLK